MKRDCGQYCVAILLVVVRAIFPNCRQSVEDEEDACDQWTLQFLLCRSRSDRNCSFNMTVPLSESSKDIGNDSSLFTLKSCKFVSLLAENRSFSSWDPDAGRR